MAGVFSCWLPEDRWLVDSNGPLPLGGGKDQVEICDKDVVKADVNVVDAGSGEIIGSTMIESKDRLAGGGPELFISDHAKAISKFLQGK